MSFLGHQNAPESSAAAATLQTPLKELTALTQTLAGFKGPTSKFSTSKGRGWKGKRGEALK